jgi:PAS domain S-box-containing protein
VEDSIDGLVIVEGAQVRFANPAALEMLGYQSQEEMVGRPFTDFAQPEYRELMLERARARQRGENPPSRYGFGALRKDGSTFPAEISVGQIVIRDGAAGDSQDITERHRAEEDLRRRNSGIRAV